MSSKQIKLLITILGIGLFISLIALGIIGGYLHIVSNWGIDAPFEDFTNINWLIDLFYKINAIDKKFPFGILAEYLTIYEDGSFVGCIPFTNCN